MSWYDILERIDGRRHLKRMCYNMAGTGALWNTPTDPTSVVAAAVDGGYFTRQGIPYRAQAVPMGGSVDEGAEEHLKLLDAKPAGMHWVGVYYSQSGIVAHHVYNAILGTTHDETLDAMLIFGPPCRAKGVARGNSYAGWQMPGPNTRGIADERFPAEEERIIDFVNRGDIYGEVEDNDVGEDMTMVYRVIQNPKALLTGKDSALEQMGEIMTSPLREVPAAIKAIWNGLTFVKPDPWPTYPHTSYDPWPAVRYLQEMGLKEPVPL